VLDPLCPACKGFDARLEASGLTQELALEAVLFPLDASCNWMVKDSLHPGACAVSEAMLCLPKEAPTILESAFREQEQWLALAREDEAKLRRLLEQRFPKVKGCLGSAKAKNRVNKSLRFAVTNALPVLTPQLFIGDKRLCEEDTDLGLEYTVRRMINEVRP
jgi:protein-disulfide isomerase